MKVRIPKSVRFVFYGTYGFTVLVVISDDLNPAMILLFPLYFAALITAIVWAGMCIRSWLDRMDDDSDAHKQKEGNRD